MEPGEAIKGNIPNNPATVPTTTHPHQNHAWKIIKEWVVVIVVALFIAYIVRSYIIEPFIVEGASMDPTFATNQFLVVDRVSYRFMEPHRGDVIVFAFPGNTKIDYIKRVIGLPGETLKIKDGVITVINAAYPKGIVLVEPYIDPMHASQDNMTVTLGASQYFVMGDNRSESYDSRAWGPVNRDLIIGRPAVRLFPLNMLSIFPGEYKE